MARTTFGQSMSTSRMPTDGAVLGQRDGQVGGDGRLADAALAAVDADLGADAPQAVGDRALLLELALHLLDLGAGLGGLLLVGRALLSHLSLLAAKQEADALAASAPGSIR